MREMETQIKRKRERETEGVRRERKNDGETDGGKRGMEKERDRLYCRALMRGK